MMRAQMLVRAIDNVHPDPDTDKGSYKAGDIVIIHGENHVWGDMEGLPDFYVIIVDYDPARKTEIEIHLMELMEVDGDFSLDIPIIKKRRKFKIDKSMLKNSQIDDITLTGKTVITIDDFLKAKKVKI